MAMFKETSLITVRKKITWLTSINTTLNILKHSKIKKIFVIWFIFQFGWNFFFHYAGEFFNKYHHLDNNTINYIFALLGSMMLVIQLTIVQPFIRFMSTKYLLTWTILGVGTSLIAFALIPVTTGKFYLQIFMIHLQWRAPSNLSFYSVLFLYCIAMSFFLATMHSYVSNLAKKHEQGTVMAMLFSSQSFLGIVVGSIGVIANYYPITPSIIGGTFVLLSALVWKMTN